MHGAVRSLLRALLRHMHAVCSLYNDILSEQGAWGSGMLALARLMGGKDQGEKKKGLLGSP